MTISVTLMLIIGAVYCLAHRGRDWPAVIIFTCLGVYAADTFIGDAARGIVNGVTNLFGSISF